METVTDRKQFIKELKRRLKKRDLAISTLSRSDKAAALSMKERSYLWWRVGPLLRAGSFVAIYVPLGATEFS